MGAAAAVLAAVVVAVLAAAVAVTAGGGWVGEGVIAVGSGGADVVAWRQPVGAVSVGCVCHLCLAPPLVLQESAQLQVCPSPQPVAGC